MSMWRLAEWRKPIRQLREWQMVVCNLLWSWAVIGAADGLSPVHTNICSHKRSVAARRAGHRDRAQRRRRRWRRHRPHGSGRRRCHIV